MVEALYLVGQQLRETLSKEEFEHRLMSTPDKLGGEKVKSTVLDILDSIEKDEGAQMRDIPSEVRTKYSSELDAALDREIKIASSSLSEFEVLRELELLRLER